MSKESAEMLCARESPRAQADQATETDRKQFLQLTSENFEELASSRRGPGKETMLQKCPGNRSP
jgi:hypothetical protein